MSAFRSGIELPTAGLTRDETMVVLVSALRALNWGVEHMHPMRVVAVMPTKKMIHGDIITIELGDSETMASSRPNGWSPFARKTAHQQNLGTLAAAFAEARAGISAEQMASELAELEESGLMQLDASTSHANEFKWKDIGSFFIPTRGFWATPLLIDMSVLVYILMVATGVHFIEPTGEDLVLWGANFRPLTVAGDWWRLVSACFVHIGIIHIAFNMYALAIAGIHLEPLIGRWRMIALYLITGIAASLASLWWHENTISAGASGAIFGLYGVFLALLLTNLLDKDVRKQLLSSIGIFVVYNLMYGLTGGVDNAAHIGGLVSGLLCGFALYPALRKPQDGTLRIASIVIPGGLVLLATVVMLLSLRNDDQQYEARIQAFFDNQEVGLVFFAKWDAGEGDLELLKEVKERSLPAWYANRELLYELDALKLSTALAEQHAQLHRYCDLRLKNFDQAQLLLSGVGRSEGLDEFNATLSEIDLLLKEMNGTPSLE
jgi:rhomboid protease GluP